ncbi:MAG: type IX secretion system PorP/SprF family membrane protein [Parvicella sp.]|jgi:type IX secretion system PorP/SprF family membrane protein
MISKLYRHISVVAVMASICFTMQGQQQGAYSNFLLNNYYYNAAIAGSENVHVGNISYRNQWASFEGAPVTFSGSFYGSYKNKGKVGYGASIISDRIGLMQNTGVYINYAQHFQLNDKYKLGIGIQPGYVQYRIRLYDAQLADQGDAVLTGSVLSANAIDLNSGLHFYSSKMYVMLGMSNMLGKSVQFTSYNENLARHFNLIAGYKIQLKSQKKMMYEPSIMISSNTPVRKQATLLLRATYDSKFWGGLMYRSSDAIGIVVGINLQERLSVGYAYDYTLSNLGSYSNGSHEISLRFITTTQKPTLDEEDEELNNSIMDEMKQQLKDKK